MAEDHHTGAPATPTVRIVVLAAGASRRMGVPKQLLHLAGETLVRRSARLAVTLSENRAEVAGPAIVVSGAAGDAVARELADLDTVEVVRNHDHASGMASSLCAGLAAARSRAPCDAVLILLCDQPLVSCACAERLLDAYLTAPERPAVSTYDGLWGVPAVIPASRFDALARLTGDRGARALLRGERRITQVPMPAAALDLDTPEDLEALRRMIGGADDDD